MGVPQLSWDVIAAGGRRRYAGCDLVTPSAPTCRIGYSVFAVCAFDPSGELPLVRTEADDVAGTLPQPTSAGTAHLNTARAIQQRSASGVQSGAPAAVEGAEDEDLMLQAALQASLMGDAGFGEGEAPAWLQDYARQAEPALPPPAPAAFFAPPAPRDDDDDMDADDPVQASIARSRALLDSMRRQQDVAMRGAIDDDIMQHIQRAQAASNMPAAAPGPSIPPPAAGRRRTGADEEDELLQQALAASQGHIVYDSPARQNRFADLPRQDGDDDDDMEVASANTLPGSTRAREEQVVYDDDDAELQAALRASLAALPEDFMVPPSPGPPPAPVRASTAPQQPAATPGGTEEEEEEDVPAKEPSPEELRRRRLARFS